MKNPMRIRSGAGLGDSLYLQSVARYFVQHGQNVEAISNWPDVFRPLRGHCIASQFNKARAEVVAHYSTRKKIIGTTQFQDCCITAGIKDWQTVELKLDWVPDNTNLIRRIEKLSHGKLIIVVQLPRNPMGRVDGFGAELLPNCKVIQQFIDEIGARALFVLVGHGHPLFHFKGIDLDLTNKTSVADVLDIAYGAHAFLGYCSFIIPLAESFLKPLMCIWSQRGLDAPHTYINTITPQKILHYTTSTSVMDSQPEQERSVRFAQFFDTLASSKAA